MHAWPAGSPCFRASAEDSLAGCFHDFQLLRLKSERFRARMPRVVATACWHFPIYSQTFVYQELTQLAQAGFDLRFLYSRLNPRDHLAAQFSRLWGLKRKLILQPAVCLREYRHYSARMPRKVEALVDRLSRASGLSHQELRNHHHFLQSFAFTRMVEAYQPDYVHSYFFYEGTLFAFVASFLLGIPRGVSCYADHMLEDYVLKATRLHLEDCSIVIATSDRIKRELTKIAPQAEGDRIVVKPNAIGAAAFRAALRPEPRDGSPYRLVCVSRIEPKKGLVYLVDAVKRVLDRNLPVRLRVLGAPDDSDTSREYARLLEARIRELGLYDYVALEGRRSAAEVQQALEAAHLFVAPFVETQTGDKDGIPTCLLEAMATGLPAVCTDAGSIPEVIENGEDGVLVPQRDAGRLADVIEAILRNPEARGRMGMRAAAKIRRQFDIAVCEHRFHDRLRQVIAARRGQGAQ